MIDIEKLSSITIFRPDRDSHILLKKEICRTCQNHACVALCPAKCYTYDEKSERLSVVFENCLECGTCYVACDKGAVDWTYPKGGYGVSYRMT
jgi:ferredoxin like protein